MRLYAVITPPPTVLKHLQEAVDGAARGSDVPWTDPAIWGCMLARLGSLGLHELTIVKKTLTEISSYCPPMTLRLTAAEARPTNDKAEELGFGITGDVDALWSLARAIPSMVQPHGLFLDRRSFHPVVGVAYGTQKPFHAGNALAALSGYVGPEWTATEMRLVRLVPHNVARPGVGDYEDMARYSFTAPVEAAPHAGSHKST